MGSFFADLLSKGAEKIADKFEGTIGKAETSTTGKAALNIWGNKEYELNLYTDAFGKMHNDNIRIQDQTLDAENKKLDAVREWWQANKSARTSISPDAKINEFHAHAVATNDPITKVTSQLVSAGDGNLNFQQLAVKNQHVARLAALAGSWGQHYENATPIIAQMLESKDAGEVANAHRVADIISNSTRDTVQIKDRRGVNTAQSYAKVQMNKAFENINKIRAEAGVTKQVPFLDTEKTYTVQSNPERVAHRIINRMLTPFIAIPHIGQLFTNIGGSAPLSAIGASLLRMNHDEAQQTIEASGILASTAWDATYRDILGETGQVAKITKNPTLGRIMNKVTYQPGFNFVRRNQLNMAGSVGFHSAIYWAHNFAESGSKIAEARLKEMGLSPEDVLAQKGKLTEEQLQKGVYHYVNNRLFFNRSIDNSLYQNKNVFTRAFYMYHSFLGSQVSFISRELMLMARAGDIRGLAQFAGTLGILFPTTIAPLLGSMEVLLRTGSPTQAGQNLQKSYGSLVNASSPGEWLGNYISLLAHAGTAGVYFNYMNAIKAHRLAAAMGGPMLGLATTDTEDLVNAFRPNKSGSYPVDPLMRDVLKQALPVIGSPLAHILLPTTAETKALGSLTPTHIRHSKRMRRKF